MQRSDIIEKYTGPNLVRDVFLAHLCGFLGFFNNQRSLHTCNTKVVKEQAASSQMGKFLDTQWTAKNRKGVKKLLSERKML